MLFNRKIICEDCNEVYRSERPFRKLYSFTWWFGVCAIGRRLLSCVLTTRESLNDFSKYSDLGSSHTFQYYLLKNNFDVDVLLLLWIGIEWIHYIVQCNRLEQKKPTAWGIWAFGILMVIHAVMWVYGSCLPFQVPPDFLSVISAAHSRGVANMAVFPSTLYFTAYFLRLRNARPQENP